MIGDERRRAFERLLAFTDLARFTDRLAGKLSGGMKQKLGLACALIRTPRLLLLDEPSVGVDPISRRELWQMVYELVDQGIGVVWSTAYLDEAERCAAVLLLNEGQVLYDGPPEGADRPRRGPQLPGRRTPGDARRQVAGRGAEAARGHRRRDPGEQRPPGDRRDGAAAADAGDARGRAGSTIEPTPPRFEDAFVDLLGGGPKGESPLAGAADRRGATTARSSRPAS